MLNSCLRYHGKYIETAVLSDGSACVQIGVEHRCHLVLSASRSFYLISGGTSLLFFRAGYWVQASYRRDFGIEESLSQHLCVRQLEERDSGGTRRSRLATVETVVSGS